MYDVLVLAPGGGWATDQTGPLTYCRTRIHDLAAATRGRRQITRLVDRRTGRDVA
jgi:hypothetical protein